MLKRPAAAFCACMQSSALLSWGSVLIDRQDSPTDSDPAPPMTPLLLLPGEDEDCLLDHGGGEALQAHPQQQQQAEAGGGDEASKRHSSSHHSLQG